MVELATFSIIEDLPPGELSFTEVLQKVNEIEKLGNELKSDKSTGLLLCMQANALGTIALKAGDHERAERLLLKAVDKYTATRDLLPFSHLMYNLANVYMALKNHGLALQYYNQALQMSPFNQVSSFYNATESQGQFNSQSCYAHTLSNLAVIYLLMSTGKASVTGDYERSTEAAQRCIRAALSAMPEGEGSEAYINMNNVMRQMGCKTEAFNYTWLQLGQSVGYTFEQPEIYKCIYELEDSYFTNICFVCVKYGTKYGADYVNKLFWGVKQNCTIAHTFICFTEDAEGLDPEIQIKPLKNKWQGWWSKVHIFDRESYAAIESTRVFYIDLDMIISGNLDDLAQMSIKRFATLTTDEIFCENVQGGYNSSIMVFDSRAMDVIYQTLVAYYDHLLKYLMRFDHFLEMMVWDCTIVQKVLPGQVLDYMQTFIEEKQVSVPADCRVIAFPRQPKPHEISDEWASKLWVYKK